MPLFSPSKVHAADGVPGQAKFIPVAITTCQELQDMDNDVRGTYVLSNDLDCNGFGFTPIGFFGTGDGGYDNFAGNFYGQGHTISNLGVPLFALLSDGMIANLNLSGNLSVEADRVGSLAYSSYYGLISDVHVNSTATLDVNSAGVGGLVGFANGSVIKRSSAVINIQVEASQTEFGGLTVGASETVIQDSYAVLTVNVASGGVEHGGGLTVGGGGNQIIRSYASGSINNNSQVHEIGGLVWFGSDTTVVDSFSTFQGAGLCNGTNGCSGLVTVADDGLDFSTNYFDQTAIGSNRCVGDGTNNTCNRVNTDGSQPNYFNNNTTNGPLDNWNFTDVWMTTVGLPTLRTFSDPSPQPDPVGQLTATIGSSSSINLDWLLPASPGSAPLLAEVVYYQKVGETEWTKIQATDFESHSDPSANFTGINLKVANLDPGTSYNFEVIAYNQDGYYSSETVSGVTGTPGLTLITNCQQLQDITNNLVDNFELGRNIDCSDTINWNSGNGFMPIGCDPDANQSYAYKGVFAGNNYTISNIYVGGGYDCYTKAIFADTEDALIQDVIIDNPIIHGSLYGNYGNAILSTYDYGSTFSNIHVRFNAVGDDQAFSGGIIGATYGETATRLSHVSVVGSITGDIGLVGGFGGLVFNPNSLVVVNDSYAQFDIIDINPESGSYSGTIGGLFGNTQAQVQITNSYAALNFDGTDSYAFENESHLIGGLIGYTYVEPVITHSFARTSIQGYPGDPAGIGGLIGVIFDSDDDPDTVAPPLNLGGNYFDADTIGTNQCAGSYVGEDSVYSRSATCTAITGQPNYFNNNSTSPPLNSWDFDNIWQVTSTLPVFSPKVLNAITLIPSTRLTSKPTATTTFKETIPAQPITSRAEIIQFLEERGQVAKTATEPSVPQGILEQLKELISRVPVVVLVNFPYALVGLLILAVLGLIIEMLRQAKRLKQLNLLLAAQRSVAEKRDTFWHLAANYLRAPITLLVGGTDLLALDSQDTPELKQLTTLSKRLQDKVARIMKQIEGSHTLQDIRAPRIEKPRRVWTSVGFWLPLGIVGVLIITTNYVAQSWRNLQLSTISLVSQILLYLVVALLLYWAISALGLVNRRLRTAKQILLRQEKALDAARLNLMQQTASELDADVGHLQTLLTKLPAKSQAKPIVQEGASRLRRLLDSFSLLITAQNHRLDSLSPASAQSSLDKVLKDTLTELEPELLSKSLTITASTAKGVRVPGNTTLNSQIVSSVLENAVSFSSKGSTIHLSLESTDAGVHLKVTDKGPGIAPAEQAHLFEPFTKADGTAGLQLDHGGLGISLYLDRQIMEYLGGQITVQSTVGQGTTTELNWPHVASRQSHPGALVHPA